jgi:SET domain-containing protein
MPYCSMDATHMGNATRFFNHHCEPNCKVVDVCCGDGSNTSSRLLVFKTLRKIRKGEELTIAYT